MKAKAALDFYLQDLVQHRPSSQLKLIAAWDGLSTETQIKILSVCNYIPDEIISKGLDSPNDYVRYLCANHFFCWSDLEKQSELDKQRLEKISNDKSTIVKFTHCSSRDVYVREKNKNGHDISVLKPENFFAMAYEEQYLYFNALGIRDGEEISKILEWGFNNSVDHEHLANLVEELESNFNKYENKYDKYISDDGWNELMRAEGLKTLWQLVPKLGDSKPARYLIWSLPTSGALFDNKVIKNVMKLLPKKLKIELKDILAPYKREVTKSYILISLFTFGLICGFLDINDWFSITSIIIPLIFWAKKTIKQ